MCALMRKTKISIPEKNRIELVQMLNKTLANISDLYLQIKQMHWNIKGPEFIALHKLLDEVAERVEEHVDIVAERATSLGGIAFGTAEEIVKNSVLRKYPVALYSIEEYLEQLTHNFAIAGELVRNDIKKCEDLADYATGDVFIALTRELDKDLWLLESNLK